MRWARAMWYVACDTLHVRCGMPVWCGVRSVLRDERRAMFDVSCMIMYDGVLFCILMYGAVMICDYGRYCILVYDCVMVVCYGVWWWCLVKYAVVWWRMSKDYGVLLLHYDAWWRMTRYDHAIEVCWRWTQHADVLLLCDVIGRWTMTYADAIGCVVMIEDA